MQISITIRNVYGNETAYPACETSRLFAAMLGRKTLTRTDLTCINRLGYDINVTADTGRLVSAFAYTIKAQ